MDMQGEVERGRVRGRYLREEVERGICRET